MARSTLLERRHLVQAYTWQGVPLTTALTRLTLGFHARLERLWEWETLIPKVTPLPQKSHLAISLHLLSGITSMRPSQALDYDNRLCSKMQALFFKFLSFFIFRLIFPHPPGIITKTLKMSVLCKNSLNIIFSNVSNVKC